MGADPAHKMYWCIDYINFNTLKQCEVSINVMSLNTLVLKCWRVNNSIFDDLVFCKFLVL